MTSTIKVDKYTLGLFVLMSLSFLIGFSTIIGKYSLVSLLFSISFIVLLLLSILYFYDHGYNPLIIAILVLSSINVLFNYSINTTEPLSFSFLKKLLLFLSTILALYLFSELKEKKVPVALIVVGPVFLNILIIIDYFVLSHRHLYYFTDLETFGFDNPNFAGIWLLHLLLYCFYCFFNYRKTYLRIVFFLIIVLDLYLIYITGNRSSLLVIILFVINMLLLNNTKWKQKVKPYSLIVVLLPILSVGIYYLLLSIPRVEEWLSFLISDGKELDSRVGIWEFGLNRFKGISIFLGDYYGVYKGVSLSHLHNSHLDVLVSYGVFPFILFCFMLYRILISLSERVNSFISTIAFSSFIAILMIGIFEAFLVSGSTGLNYFSAGFILLVNNTKTSQSVLNREVLINE